MISLPIMVYKKDKEILVDEIYNGENILVDYSVCLA